MKTIPQGTACELCKRNVISGRMVENPGGGYVCEECCHDLADGKIVIIGEEE